MDDIIWWCADRAQAKLTLQCVERYLWQQRGLRIKPATQINRSDHGVSYCGHRVTLGAVRLSNRRRRRYKALRQDAENAWKHKQITALELQQQIAAVHGIAAIPDARTWRREHLQRTGSIEV